MTLSDRIWNVSHMRHIRLNTAHFQPSMQHVGQFSYTHQNVLAIKQNNAYNNGNNSMCILYLKANCSFYFVSLYLKGEHLCYTVYLKFVCVGGELKVQYLFKSIIFIVQIFGLSIFLDLAIHWPPLYCHSNNLFQDNNIQSNILVVDDNDYIVVVVVDNDGDVSLKLIKASYCCCWSCSWRRRWQ